MQKERKNFGMKRSRFVRFASWCGSRLCLRKRERLRTCSIDRQIFQQSCCSSSHIQVVTHSNGHTTWPSNNLHSTVKNILSKQNMDPDMISKIYLDIEQHLYNIRPFEVEDQYDFCIIHSQCDFDEACEFLNILNIRYELVGHLVCASIGEDRFIAVQKAVKQSSRVILYITSNFVKDEFCCHLARNSFITNHSKDIKIIPVVKDSGLCLPQSLQLVNKLALDRLQQLEFTIPKVFTDCVKQEKFVRKYNLEVKIDFQRNKIVNDLIVKKSLICKIN